MRLPRTQFALEEINQHVATHGRNPLIETYFVQYLLIAFYSEVEEQIKTIIQNRLSEVTDARVGHFIFLTNEAMIRRVKKAEINDVLRKFKCGDGDVISQYLEHENLQPYFDAITNRHLVSHSDGVTMTLDSFAAAIPCANKILQAVEVLIAQPAH